ncbi:MAG: NfeD family protein [bacterium]|nr:NfeD family protein [bacterium]
MDMWLILLIVSVIFLVLEMFTPTLFFINLAVAVAVSAIFSYLGFSNLFVTFVFLIVSIAAIWLVRPILLKQINEKKVSTGLDDKYIGKVAKVVKEVTNTDGRVAIYGEEWQAVTDGEAIAVGSEVKILSNDSIIFKVEKI